MKGGKREGAGRPPGTKTKNPRNIIKQIRWTEEEWKEVEKICKEFKISYSEYARHRILNKNHY